MQLIDTSAWIEYLRGTGSPAHREVRRLLENELGDVVVTEPIVMELLAGPTDPQVVAKLERLVDGLAVVPVHAELDYRAAATVYRAARQGGRAVRSLVDCVIAVVAARAQATLVHRDRDFASLARCLPELHLRSL